EPDRPERRGPQNTGADRGIHEHAVVRQRERLAGRPGRRRQPAGRTDIVPERAGVGEYRQLHAGVLGQEVDRRLEFETRHRVDRSAERVLEGAGREVARPDTRGREAADELRAHLEVIEHAQAAAVVLLAPAVDVAALHGKHADYVLDDFV